MRINEDYLDDIDYLHGDCQQWVIDNFHEGDIIVVIQEFDWEIETTCMAHSLLMRDGRYLDVRGYMDTMDEVLEEFDCDDSDVLLFNSVSEFEEYLDEMGIPYSLARNRVLDEKFGSALDNPEIFTPEVIDVINDVTRTVDDDAFDDWEPMMLFGGDCLSKVYNIKETSWTSAIQFVAFAGPHPFPAYKKVRGLCSFVEFNDEGKVEPSILLFNTKTTSGDEYFEIIIHELKHAYYKFRHPNTKNLEMKYDLLNKPMFIYGENLLNMSPEEVIEKYKTNRDWTSGCIIRNLVYVCSKTELTAYAETVNMEIARFAREGKSIDELKRDSKYVSHFLLLANMFRQIDADVKSNPEFLKTLDEMCKKWYDKSFKYIWETSRKSLNKQLANIRKSIGMYY